MKPLTLLLTLGVLLTLATTQAADRPNIILIMADDIGHEAMSHNGAVSTSTPHLDQLASEGIHFTHAYAQPLCTPSRVKIMTGLSNRRNYQHFGYLDINARTFAHDLSDHGYHTAIVGKWQLNGRPVDTDLPPLTRPQHFGFHTWRLWQLADTGRIEKVRQSGKIGRIDARYANPVLNTDGTQTGPIDGAYGPELCLQWTKERITQWSQDEQPFLIYYPLILPHNPFYPTPHSEIWSDPDQRLKTDGRPQRYWTDMVAYLDHIVGQLRTTLIDTEIAENTWLIFTGDNGTNPAIKTLHESGQIITGGKGQTTDAGTHVPFVAWQAGMKNPGTTSDTLIDFADLTPTIWDLAQVPTDKRRPTDGISFADILHGKKSKRHKPAVHVFYNANKVPDDGTPRTKPMSDSQEFVRTQRFKLYADDRYYDIERDPLEETPLSLGTLKGEAKKTYPILEKELSQWTKLGDKLTP